MKSLKEFFKNIYEKTEHYQLQQIKEDWEKQNIQIDELQQDLSKQVKKNAVLRNDLESEKSINKELILNGQQVVEEKVATIKSLEKYISELKNKIEGKENARRKLAGKIGGYQAKINKLETQVEFLKKNRRAPKLEEIKDYEYKRKRSVDKNV